MGKVFRLHSQGSNNLAGWENSAKYTDTVINSIDDPAGANAYQEITSIPTPFARMDLVKRAFGIVCEKDKKTGMPNLSGNTIHHKMVSHTLDIAQMFFSLDKFTGNNGCLELIKWNKQAGIQELKGSNTTGHKLMGNTLSLFLEQDRSIYNFDKMDSIYMLRFTVAGGPLNIIGATSPATLFFSSANDFSGIIGNTIRFGNHRALGQDGFQALHERTDEDFICYLYALRSATNGFAILFPEVNAYLDLTFSYLNENLRSRINALNQGSLAAEFLPLDVTNGVPVEVLGIQLYKACPFDIGEASSFGMKATKHQAKRPLVLPVTTFAKPWTYVNARWDQNTVVPINNAVPINNRTLPDDGAEWPYLTVDDLLCKTIIELDRTKVNEKEFFDGNLIDNTGRPHGFLLPIRRAYFDYFNVNDLKNQISMTCTLDPQGDASVTVCLNIPVNGGIMTLERLYNHQNNSDAAPLNPRDGVVITQNMTLVLAPKMQFPANTQADYRINLLTRNTQCDVTLQCVDNSGNNVPATYTLDKNRQPNGALIDQSNTPVRTPILAVQSNFAAIDIKAGDNTGLLIPLWAGIAGTRKFAFAIDFGTTNTHIEYTIDGGHPHELDIKEEHTQLSMLSDSAINEFAYRLSIYNNDIPQVLGQETPVHFPLRTILSFHKDTNWNQPVFPYITGSLAYYYGAQIMPTYNDTESNLKWSTDSDIQAKIRCYLASIIMLIRNKVLMEGGDLSQTELTWFYPTSMPAGRVAAISNIWNGLFQEYINPNAVNNNLYSMPESIAPYNFHSQYHGAGVDVLTIDIGGGTSDAVVIDSTGNQELITSFRFAANSLFGDAFTRGNIAQNGWVNKFKEHVTMVLRDNNLGNILRVLQDVEQKNNSSDYISLLFTLHENKEVISRKCDKNLNFMTMLSGNDGARTLTLIFYSAIIYHLAHIIKAEQAAGKNVREPESIAFSGNGAKLLRILGADTPVGRDVLSSFTMELFNKVLGKKVYAHSSLKIILTDNPKEATCKGGLVAAMRPALTAVRKLTKTYLGTKEPHLVSGKQYDQLTSCDIEGVSSAVADFANIFFELAKSEDIQNTFSTIQLSELQKYHTLFTQGNDNRINNALNFLKLQGQQSPIEDTLFFYPLTTILNDLASKIL